MWQNTEKHNIFVYAFLKTSEKSPDFSKTNRVTHCICMNLSLPNVRFISKKKKENFS